jgi:cytochrome d ubiquinol oxidase subunit II
MSLDTLAIIWFVLWGVIWTVYFILDAYSLGTGMIFPLVTKNRKERNQLQETIGPFWGGNEVWLVTAGGATFAAFPAVYATMFSSLYEAMLLLLFALFFRGAGLELMHKDDNPLWQKFFKWAFTISSYALPLLLGVAFSNLYYGLLLGENGYEGSFFKLLHAYSILGGLVFIALFMTSGALWVMIKNTGEVVSRSYKIAKIAAPVAAAAIAMFFVGTMNESRIADNFNEYPVLFSAPVATLLISLATIYFIFKNKIKSAFASVCITIFALSATGFIGMFPNMLISRIDEAYSLTLYNSSGSQKNLQLMFYVAVIMVPIVISYQIWSYTLFKKKITTDEAKGY